MKLARLDPDRVYDIDLKMKFRLDDLFWLGDKYNLDNDVIGLYNVLNCIHMRVLFVMDDEDRNAIKGMIGKIDSLMLELAKRQRGSSVGVDYSVVKPLLNEWNILLHKVCIKNKFWYKKRVSDEERLDQVENVEEKQEMEM